MVKKTKRTELVKEVLFALKVLANEDKARILDLCKKKPLTMPQLKEKLKINSKLVWKYTKELEKVGYVKTQKYNNLKRKPVYVQSLLSFQKSYLSALALAQLINEELEEIEKK